ncbi:MAG: hypothetical protein LIO46_01090 [Clostridiales bacterium]|nr:hypothetical protein [Clostridiales bacterium]
MKRRITTALLAAALMIGMGLLPAGSAWAASHEQEVPGQGIIGNTEGPEEDDPLSGLIDETVAGVSTERTPRTGDGFSLWWGAAAGVSGVLILFLHSKRDRELPEA